MTSPSAPSSGNHEDLPDSIGHNKTQQDGLDAGMRVLAILISGIVFYGALGWGLDFLLNTGFCMPIGLIIGTVAGIYLVIKKYGQM